MSALGRDVRSGLRQLLGQPLTSLVAILSLAIALGAGTLLYSAVDALLLSSMPGIAQPERQLEVGHVEDDGAPDSLPHPVLRDIATQARSLDRVYGFSFLPLNLLRDGRAVRVSGFAVTPSYFDALGVGAATGRLFVADDDTAVAVPVLVASENAFQRWFGGRAEAIGSLVQVNGRSFTLVGVTQAGFRGHIAALVPDFYMPLTQATRVGREAPEALDSYASYWVIGGARLAAGATIEDARSELATIAARIHTAHPEVSSEGFRIGAAPLRAMPSGFRGVLGLLAGFLAALVGLVLLVACSNVAGLLLARGEQRQREIAVRRVLGAGRAVIVRQLLVEALLLALIAAAAGLLLAIIGRDLILELPIPTPVPVALEIPFVPGVIVFALVVSVPCTLLFGLAPALRASDATPQRALSQAGSSARTVRGRARGVLVGAQVAFTLLLLIVSALIVRALGRADAINPGCRIEGISTADLDLTPTAYAEADSPTVVARVLDSVAAQPGIARAAAAAVLPLGFSRMGFGPFRVDGGTAIDANVNIVAGPFFEALDIPVRGRRFEPADSAGAPGVTIVNQALAERLAPGGDVLGRTVQLGSADDPMTLRVVGVTPDGQYSRLGESGVAFAYLPHAQVPRRGMNLILRTDLPAPLLERQLAAAIAAVDPALPAPTVQQLRDIARLALLPQRIGSAAAGALGSVGLLLAALGVYGQLAGYVAGHVREIGIRLALGAARRRIAAQVLRSAAWAVGLGAAAGLAAGVALAHVLAAQLLGVHANDVAAFAIGLAAVLAIAAIAVIVPLRRAIAVEPMQALRYE